MNNLRKIAFAALTMTGAMGLSSAPADAGVGISLSFGSPGYRGDYDYGRPCWFYHKWNMPAPARCYRDFYGYYGSNVFITDGFVFRDRDDYGRWRYRDNYRRWTSHGHGDWDHGDHRGWDRGDHHGSDHGDHHGWNDDHGNRDGDRNRDNNDDRRGGNNDDNDHQDHGDRHDDR